jgi:hypothetical protein
MVRANIVEHILEGRMKGRLVVLIHVMKDKSYSRMEPVVIVVRILEQVMIRRSV